MRAFKNLKPNLSGLSLVEVMVGMVIGLLTIIVIMQAYSAFEGQKRTTTGGVDAQENGLIALHMLQTDLRQAGYGYTAYVGTGGTNPVLGCDVRAYNQNASPQEIPFLLIPALIRDGGTGSDAITVTYSTSNNLTTPVSFTQPSSGAANYKVPDNIYKSAFAVGDLILASEAGQPCTMGAITGLTGSGSNVLSHTSGQSDYNRPSGQGVTYSQNFCSTCKLINLGVPAINQYFVSSENNLSVADLKLGTVGGVTNSVALANNIVNIQAQYGLAPAGSQNVTCWVNATTGNACDSGNWTPAGLAAPSLGVARIKAIRLAIVARSGLPEKPSSGSACDATPSAPVLFNGVSDAPVVALTGNWQCYRYQVYETIVPLRNILWANL